MNGFLSSIRKRAGGHAVCLLMGFAAASAQATGTPAAPLPSQAPDRLSLVEAQQIAFTRNWDVLAARSDVDAATAQKIVAKEFPNPTANLSVTKISVDSSHPSEGSSFWQRDYDSVAAVNQLFEIGGKRKSRQLSAEAGLAGARARLADARRTLDLAVATAYAAAALANANVSVLRDSADSLRREADIAADRLKAGDISTADKSRIEITAEQFELDAQSAQSAAKSARVQLGLLMGVSNFGPAIQLTDSLENLAGVYVSDTEGGLAIVRADLVAAEQALKKSEADLQLQKAQRIPDPTFLAQYEHEPPDQPNTVGFGVSFPLPLWNRNRGAIKAAEAAREQANTQVEKVTAQIAADITTARLDYGSASKRWQSYRDQLRPQSEHIRQAVAFAYEKGGASLLDLLSAERDDNAVRLAAAQSAHDVAVAAAALQAATEVMNKTTIKP
jgi:cobalt-zinc-cadmium efflux system outer membrane protein